MTTTTRTGSLTREQADAILDLVMTARATARDTIRLRGDHDVSETDYRAALAADDAAHMAVVNHVYGLVR